MITTLTLFALVLVTGGLVVWPVIQGARRPWALDVPSGEEEALRQEQAAALEALRDLAMDFRLGNLAEEDYRALAGPLQQRARRTLAFQAARQITPVNASSLDNTLEAEILVLRRAPERRSKPEANGAVRFCPACGTSVSPNFRFCAACGNPLPAQPETKAIASQIALPLTAPAAPLAPMQPEAEEDPAPAPPAPVQAQEESQPTSRRWLWWVGALVAAVWVVGIVWFYTSSRADQETQIPVADLPGVALRHISSVGGQYFAGEGNGLHLSEDGRSWSDSSFTAPVRTVVSLDAASQLLLVSEGQGLWRSNDNGQTWLPQTTTPADLALVAAAGHSALPGFLIGADARRLYISEDGGRNWRPMAGELPGSVRALALGRGVIFAGTSRGVFRSEDGGLSWISMNGSANGAIASTDVQALVYDDANGIVYAGTAAGLSFMNMSSFGGWGERRLRAQVTALALEPDNPGVLWVGAVDGRIFRSPDRGVSWR